MNKIDWFLHVKIINIKFGTYANYGASGRKIKIIRNEIVILKFSRVFEFYSSFIINLS